MEDEKSLDLSLSLPCGGSSSSLKDKYGSSSDIRSDEGDRGSKIINEFKNFLEGGTQQNPLKIEESFYNYGEPVVNLESSKNSNAWLRNDRRSAEIEEENRSSVGEKRKNLYIDTNHEKKHERETEKSKTSHISITTDEGSTAENEDVADSEVDGSTSRQVPQPDDASKRLKEMHDFGNPSGVEILGQKRFTIASEKEFSPSNVPMSYGVPFSGTPSLSSYSLHGMMHTMAATNGDRPVNQPVGPSNYPSMFGYNPVQLPALDRDNSRGMVSRHQQIHANYSGRNIVNPETQNDSRNLTQGTLPLNISQKSSESIQYDARAVEHGKNNGKQHVGEEAFDQQQPKPETIPSEFPAIRPGIAAELKFGGCGTYPNLPWVSTTGTGPNGRTISGVTYRFSPTQIRIVCACHGSHMSPEEFVRHASEESTTADESIGIASMPGGDRAASAQS